MRLAVGLILLSLFGLPLTTAFAQAQPEPHDVAVAFDINGTTFCDFPEPFTTDEEFWVVGYFLDGGVAGFEFGLTIDPTLIVFSSTPNPISAINVGQPPNNWIVGTGVCLDGSGVLWFASFTYGYFTPEALDMLICLGPSTPSSFTPATPGYLRCDDALLPLNGYPREIELPYGCGVVNPWSPGGPWAKQWPIRKQTYCGPVVATGAVSWGAVKARY